MILPEDLQSILDQAAPVLPEDELKAFVGHYFNLKDNYLKVLEIEPSPLYVLESSVLKARAARFREVFQAVLPDVSFYYAVKSNNRPEVARILLDSGFGLDVSSGLELETALDLGATDIVFSGPGKTDRELNLAAVNSSKVTVLMDSFGELERLEKAAAALDRVVRAGVRLTTNPDGLWRKFGIVPGDLASFWEESGRCTHVRLQGLQFHTSWNLSPQAQVDFIRLLGRTLRSMPEAFLGEIEFIDIGGGYWPAQGEWLTEAGTEAGRLREALGRGTGPDMNHYRLPSAPIGVFAEQLGAAVREHLFPVVSSRICFEPGRWVCHDAMHILISVVDKKAPDLVVTDAGTNAVGWERFETDYFPVLNLTRPALEERPCHVLGSLCTPHDVWGYSYWGEDIRPGDVLMIPTQGAYTYSLRQNFIKPLPTFVVI